MPSFDAKPRSWEAYLAGIGASGALMASASVLFVILVGVVTFSAWPNAGSLLGDGGSPGGSNGASGQPQGAQPPAAPQQSNVVSQALSGVGNTVQKDTESLGNTLGGSSSPGLGGVLGGLGNTLNNDLQTLAGNH